MIKRLLSFLTDSLFTQNKAKHDKNFFVDAPLFDRGAYKAFQILFFWKNVLEHNWIIYKNWEDVSRIVFPNSFHIDEVHERKDKYKYFDLKFDSAKEFFIFYF